MCCFYNEGVFFFFFMTVDVFDHKIGSRIVSGSKLNVIDTFKKSFFITFDSFSFDTFLLLIDT